MSFDEKYKLVTNVHNYFILVSLLVVRGAVLRSVVHMVGHAVVNGDTVFVKVFWCKVCSIFPFYGVE